MTMIQCKTGDQVNANANRLLLLHVYSGLFGLTKLVSRNIRSLGGKPAMYSIKLLALLCNSWIHKFMCTDLLLLLLTSLNFKYMYASHRLPTLYQVNCYNYIVIIIHGLICLQWSVVVVSSHLSWKLITRLMSTRPD